MPLPLNDERLDGLSGGCHVRMDSLDMVLGYGYGVIPSVGSRHCEAAGAVNAVFFVHRFKKSCINLLLVSCDLAKRFGGAGRPYTTAEKRH